MLGLALVGPIDILDRQNWDYVLNHWKPDRLWIIGDVGQDDVLDTNQFKDAIYERRVADLPAGPEKVLFAPPISRALGGKTPLGSFIHPVDAIYIFGSNHKDLGLRDLGVTIIDHYVYIETDSPLDMYSYVAAAIALYDRENHV